jgi:hypothetical protein
MHKPYSIKIVIALALLLGSGASQACSIWDPLACIKDLVHPVQTPAASASSTPAAPATANSAQAATPAVSKTPAVSQTAASNPPCPFFGLFGCDNGKAGRSDQARSDEQECQGPDPFGFCKARQERKQQQAQDEISYQQRMNLAFTRRTGQHQGSWYADSPESACREAQFDPYTEAGQRCIRDISHKYAELQEKLRTGREKISSCREWAISKGAKWESAQTDMRLDAIAEIVTPVMFRGEVEGGKNGTLTIRHDADNACVSVNASTVVIHKTSLRVGQELRGYGLQTGRQVVQQIDGQPTRVPVIEAACLE